MKITYNWLKEFVELKVSPEKLSEQLTMAGLSVASLERAGDDWVYDIEVTSNRPDWLSARGIAREVAAMTGGKLKPSRVSSSSLRVKSKKNSKNSKPAARGTQPFSITIEDKKGCGLYCGALIKNVKVASSPEALKKRLEALGIRPINNAVDITNYCMMEFGQPLHAFDFNKIQGASVRVRRSREGERLVLIDGSEKKLKAGVLVIADSQKPMAAAGIMGGKDSEVTEGTTDILLESAYFDPVVVRQGTRSLGVASDASYRFERNVDKTGVRKALDAAIAMMVEYCGGTFVSVKDDGIVTKEGLKKIQFDLNKIPEILSMTIPQASVRGILEGLGFDVRVRSKNILEVGVPSFRRDVKIVEDLIEEVVRIYGYDRIPLTAPSIKPFSFKISATQALEPELRKILVGCGLKEVITYSLISAEDFKKTGLDGADAAMHLENSLSQDFSILRPTLVPSFLKTASYNINHNNKNFEIFEISRIFRDQKEQWFAGAALCGARRASWQKDFSAYSLFDLKGVLESVLSELAAGDYMMETVSSKEIPWLSVGARIKKGDALIAVLGQVAPSIKEAWEIKSKEDIYIAEFSLEVLSKFVCLKKLFKPFVATPSICRDISVLVPGHVSYHQIEALVRKQAEGYLENLSLVERYQGKEIPAGHSGLTLSLEYALAGKTLTDEEVNHVHHKVLQRLTGDLGLKLR